MTSFREQLEKAARAILPERRVYVLFASQLPKQYRPRGCFGLTGRGLDLVLRDTIGATWQGRGAVIVLDENQAQCYVRECQPFAPEAITARRELWKAAAHEVGHVAGRLVLPSEIEDDDPGFRDVVGGALFDFCANPPPIAVACLIPWEGHDGRFIRLLFHAAHRVRLAASEWIPYCGWFDPRQYGLTSREDQYQTALGDEPERLADVPLTEIASIPPPPTFVETWRSDVRAWFLALPTPSDSQSAALVAGLSLFNVKGE